MLRYNFVCGDVIDLYSYQHMLKISVKSSTLKLVFSNLRNYKD